MSQASPTQLSDLIEWHFLSEDDQGNRHHMEPRIYQCNGLKKVVSLIVFPVLMETEFGEVSQIQCSEIVDVKAQTFRVEQEAFIDIEGNVLHLNEFLQGSEFGCPPGSVNEMRMGFVRQLLRDRRRRRIKVSKRSGCHEIGFFRKSKRTLR